MQIVNTTVPITSADNDRYIQEILRTYPFCESEIIATTAYDRPVRTLEFGDGPRKLLLSASHHANEWITSLVLLKYAEEFCARATQNPSLLTQVSICMVPMVNPDGVDLVTGAIAPGSIPYEAASRLSEAYPDIPFPEGWKADLLGVDLNLQYPAGWLQAREIKFSQGFTQPGPRDYVGRAPLTQVEAQAMAALTDDFDPDVVIAFHSQGELIFWQFRDIDVPGARELGDAMAQASGYTLSETPYNSSFAGYKDWFIQEFRRPGYTVEVGQGVNPLPIEQFDEIYRACKALLDTVLEYTPWDWNADTDESVRLSRTPVIVSSDCIK